MPVVFPTLDPATGELVDRTYYTVEEAADRLHVSHSTVRRRILAGEWPHLTIAHAHYMSGEDLARVVAMHIVEPPAPEDPPKLGTPLTDTDLEGFR